MENTELPSLTGEEARVLGCLLEKSKTTPDYYPLTLKSLQAACNQKTSRNPVVDYDEETVIQTLDSLRKKGLTGTAVGGGSRVTKYKHNLQLKFELGPDDLAVICLLLLRGPLTTGEINSNSGRLFDFGSLEEVQSILQALSEGEPAFVKQIARKPGQKERRYIQLFTENEEDAEDTTEVLPETNPSLEARVEELEAKLAALQQDFDKLMEELS